MKYCFEFELDDKRKCKVYKSVFNCSEKSGYVKTCSVQCDKLRDIIDLNILMPQIRINKDSNELELLYDDQRVLCPTLFNTYFEFIENGRKLRGDFKSVLTTSQRADLAIQLCKMFEALNNNRIFIKYPSDNMILFDYERQKIYLDIVPYILERLPQNSKGELCLIEKINLNYHLLLGYLKKSLYLKKDRIFANEPYRNKLEGNNIILSYLLHKILTGEDCLKWTAESKVSQNTSREDLVNEKINALFNKGFYDDIYSLAVGESKHTNINLLTISPLQWENKIKAARCLCGGIYKSENNVKTCDTCGKRKIGTIKHNGIVLPLLIKNQYFPEDFGCYRDSELLFILDERSGTNERALFFDCERKTSIVNQAGDYEEVKTLNANGKYYQIPVDKGQELSITADNYELKFNIED